MLVVLADGNRSFYCDAANGPAYERAIVGDLITFIDTHFRTLKRGGRRAIGGLSMGGYGALKLGLKYPGKFCSVSAHSGVYRHVRDAWWEREDNPWAEEQRRIYGSDGARRENDPFLLAEKLKPERAPAIWIDCGKDDGLLEDNRAMRRHLRKLGIKHTYREYPGGHNWAYWDEHIQDAIEFHRKAFGI